MSNLLKNMFVSVGTIQFTLNAFLALYAYKSSRFFNTPAATYLAPRLALK